MDLLTGLRVLQVGRGMAAAVCGRLFADLGAEVSAIDSDDATPLAQYLNHGKRVVTAMSGVVTADLVVCEGRPCELRERQYDPDNLRQRFPAATLVYISPYGLDGPDCDGPASDLTLFYSSGLARLLTGQVDDLDEPPIRAVGRQSAFIGGVAAACAAMHAVLLAGPALIDVSIEEALATMAVGELANAGLGRASRPRRRIADGNGATVTILPASDGYVAISPREDRQWAAWLGVMGEPDWGQDPRFLTKPDRVANWDALHELMSAWSRQYSKQAIAEQAQAAHVPSFPLREPAEQLASPQLAHRNFFHWIDIAGKQVKVPGSPFGLHIGSGEPEEFADRSGHLLTRLRVGLGSASPTLRSPLPPSGGEGSVRRAASHEATRPETALADRYDKAMPLSGVRVLDFSWVIAGPTATRYLAAMGAEVIKIEAPGRGDPGRASELHTVLGQAKRGIVLDLKHPDAVAIARALAAKSDVVIENFASGVMERLGLGPDELRAVNPHLIYVSASGLGRTGPEAQAVAYGTLLQCYAGFAGLNRHPGVAPRVGFAWLDPMCGLMLAFIVAAAVWRRRASGAVARIDFSMIEAMLWTMAEPLLQTQLGAAPQPRGNHSDEFAPHGAWRCAGEDDWLALAVTDDREWRQLCVVVPALAPLAEYGLPRRLAERGEIDAVLAAWARPQSAKAAATTLRQANIPAAALASSLDLVARDHLRERGFWDEHRGGVIPGMPWHASFGRVTGPAPALGADTDAVLRDALGYSAADIAARRAAGAFG
jgi:crotonobetainyl-CoA:carnitine CoA-transferase CaiB-like acyl-CoA transferase